MIIPIHIEPIILVLIIILVVILLIIAKNVPNANISAVSKHIDTNPTISYGILSSEFV